MNSEYLHNLWNNTWENKSKGINLKLKLDPSETFFTYIINGEESNHIPLGIPTQTKNTFLVTEYIANILEETINRKIWMKIEFRSIFSIYVLIPTADLINVEFTIQENSH